MPHCIVMLEEYSAVDFVLQLEATTAPWLLPDYWLAAPSFSLSVLELQMQSFA